MMSIKFFCFYFVNFFSFTRYKLLNICISIQHTLFLLITHQLQVRINRFRYFTIVRCFIIISFVSSSFTVFRLSQPHIYQLYSLLAVLLQLLVSMASPLRPVITHRTQTTAITMVYNYLIMR